METFMHYFDYICLTFCFLHIILSVVFNLLNGHKLKDICLKCGSLLVDSDGSPHECVSPFTSVISKLKNCYPEADSTSLSLTRSEIDYLMTLLENKLEDSSHDGT